MADRPLHILAVIGSLSRNSSTRSVLRHIRDHLRADGIRVDLLDFGQEPLPMFDPELSGKSDAFLQLKPRVEAADVILLGTPDYHGSMSGALKNFLDHFWREFAGKLFVTVVGSHDKGLTVTDQLRTVARQCYAWSLPYGIAFSDKDELQGGQITSASLQQRLEMLVRDLQVYGRLLASQRQADLAGSDPGFLSRYRPAPTGPTRQP